MSCVFRALKTLLLYALGERQANIIRFNFFACPPKRDRRTTRTENGNGRTAKSASISALWLRFFLFGPLEWLWRSLTYWNVQPFVRRG
jgi:Protein of unknown function (DUF418)